MLVEHNKIVAITYIIKDQDGNLILNNEGGKPEEYLHGSGSLLPRLEQALTGLKEDDVIDVVIPPAEAFGEREVSLILEVSADVFDDVGTLEEGQYIQLFDGTEGFVVAKKGYHIVVDANHPLAGKTLHYTVRINSVRDASQDEVRS